MGRKQLSEAGRALGRKSYRARLERFGLERLQEIARENGKLGGRPPKGGRKEKANARQAASH